MSAHNKPSLIFPPMFHTHIHALTHTDPPLTTIIFSTEIHNLSHHYFLKESIESNKGHPKNSTSTLLAEISLSKEKK